MKNSMSENKVNLKVDWCSYEAAKYAVMRWHYSKCMPIGKMIKIGAWEDRIFVGCVLFSLGSNRNMHKPFGLKKTEVCEITRIALNKHKTPVTRIVKIAFIFLKKKCPNIKLVISYADPAQGHTGQIYKAGNWEYLGETKAQDHYVEIMTGKFIHKRTVTKDSRGRAARLIKNEIIKPIKTNKHKFIYWLKRPPEGTGLSDQDKKGGSIPTRTLQT
jgi:hypothetical protein